MPTMKPTLLLDFANSRQLGPLVTFSRASTATRFNRLGLLVPVAANEPRFDFDPITLACRGLLIEEARTNLFTRSQEFSDAVWTRPGATITANTTTAPDGTVTADTLTEDTSTGTHQVRQDVAVTSGTSYTFTVFAKSTGAARQLSMVFGITFGTPFNDMFDLQAGVVASNQSGAPTISPVGNGWFRCAVTRTATSTGTATIILRLVNPAAGDILSYTGDGASGVFLWQGQFEPGLFASSPILTAASQVTRAGELAVINGAAFSAISRNPLSQFTAAVQYSTNAPPSATYNVTALSVDDGSTANAVLIRASSGGTVIDRAVVRTGSTPQFVEIPTGGPAAAGEVRTLALSLIGGQQIIARNGQFGASGSLSIPGNISALSIGSMAGQEPLNGHIRKLAFYPRALSSADTVEISRQ